MICTDVGGIRDLVTDGESGMITSQDAADFAKRLTQLVTDKSLRERVAQKGKEKTLKNYSYQRLVNDMKHLYDDLLSSR